MVQLYKGVRGLEKSIMILGVHHIDNPNNGDLFSYKNEDVSSKKIQGEINELIEALKKFNPTKIAIEIEKELDEDIKNDYVNFLNGSFKLGNNEKHQIGFKLARELGLEKLHCVNWNKAQNDVPNISQWISEHYCPSWDRLKAEMEKEILERQEYLNTHTIKEFIIKLNDKKSTLKDHQFYNKLALISNGENPIGAQWVAKYWYYRNMIIYKNIMEIFEYDEERILLIIGGAHVHLITQFFSENSDCQVVDAIHYLSN